MDDNNFFTNFRESEFKKLYHIFSGISLTKKLQKFL